MTKGCAHRPGGAGAAAALMAFNIVRCNLQRNHMYGDEHTVDKEHGEHGPTRTCIDKKGAIIIALSLFIAIGIAYCTMHNQTPNAL